ncbi:MAG TPA: response regulator [Labilithrix sp.]|jgi:CheY-like chemotaxis protein
MGFPALSGSIEEPRAERLRVLVVDDDALFRASVVRLMSQDHAIVEVHDGGEALERLEIGAPYDVVLLDLHMPHPNGIEVYEALRTAYPWLADDIVVVTAGASSREEEEFLDSIPNECLRKPFTRRELLAAIERSARRVRGNPSGVLYP